MNPKEYVCNECKISLPESSYYRSSIRKKDYTCSKCSVKRGQVLRKKQRENGDIHARYSYSKSSAKSAGKPFLLTEEEYTVLLKRNCYYCEQPIDGFGIGLDRINNDKKIGYKLGNILPCCGKCNMVRGNSFTVEETKIAIMAVINFRKQNKSQQN